MNTIKQKLDIVLSRFKMDAKEWADYILGFQKKVEFLSQTNRYKKLLKLLFASNEISQFNSHVFEILFAYDFEVKQQKLMYEANQLPDNRSSVDFLYDSKKFHIYFELGLVQQRKWITASIDSQLSSCQQYEIHLNRNHETSEAIRLQNLILSKCQKSDGIPVKFFELKTGILNFIVVNVSELHLGGIDKYDCFLTMNGDNSVPFPYRRGVFGMWQVLPENPKDTEKKLYEKFQHFRDTIHGVLFVRYKKNIGYLGKIQIDKELEYLPILNPNILPEETINFATKLLPFLDNWIRENNNKHR